MHYAVSHQFREGNKAVDSLARQEEEGKSCTYIGSDDLPLRVGGLLRLDFLGLPSIRLQIAFVFCFDFFMLFSVLFVWNFFSITITSEGF